MAKATVQTERKYTLQLTKPEAKWLQVFCQNPIIGEVNESYADQVIREAIFNALNAPDQLPEIGS